MDSISSLRHEFPALALITGFASRKDRAFLADMLLLWLEYRRATRASETLIAAARLTWWREAFETGKTGNVPLAERITKWSEHKLDLSELINSTQSLINAVLDGSDQRFIHLQFAEMIKFGLKLEDDAQSMASVLSGLSDVMDGEKAALPPEAGYAPMALIVWLCQDPSRLDYPAKHPLLALRMLLAAVAR